MRGILLRTLLCALVWSCPAGAVCAQEWCLPTDAAAPAEAGLAFDWADIHFGGVISLQEAHAAYPTVTGAGYTVAVIDSGVAMTHPALAGRYVGGYDYACDDSLPLDTKGHGTHVTGILASSDANHVGVAPEAGYAALKVSPDGSSSVSMSAVKQSLQWVLDHREEHNIVAVNLSLGDSVPHTSPVASGPRGMDAEFAALKAAGVFIAAAAGNDYHTHDGTGVRGVDYPAADVSTVCVGDVWVGDMGYGCAWSSGAKDWSTGEGRIVSHCQRGVWPETAPDLPAGPQPDLFAPGALIYSCAHDWQGVSNPDWVCKGGTSMAAPVAAGAAVLIREAIEQRAAAEGWEAELLPEGGEWQDVILRIMRDTGDTLYDGDDEDDNVTNLNELHDPDPAFKALNVKAALDYVHNAEAAAIVPEPASLWVLAGAAPALLRRRK